MRHTSGWLGQGADQETGEPSRAELLQAIQGSQLAPGNKIETVALKVNLLRTDLRKVSDKVSLAEGSIEKLQTDVASLKKQVAVDASRSGALEAGEGTGRRAREESGTAYRQSPQKIEPGTLEIQADGIMALACPDLQCRLDAFSLTQEETTLQTESIASGNLP
ncbi:hypothetical protein NDU88_002671 [Pleurodeles waltl]|uniref:Uncharacterized protein n=1 Tax=Pleurodeles waltl TaxID=8319 RepID=A0AAV7M2W2_PLEWA|nr:hypothetical protein NDU88_002671 [Pleurodeles waltl]